MQWGSDVSGFSPPFQLVLGADIIYDPRGFKPLLWTLLSLTGMGSVILISYRRRRDIEKKFFQQCEQWFTVQEKEQNKHMILRMQRRGDKIHMLPVNTPTKQTAKKIHIGQYVLLHNMKNKKDNGRHGIIFDYCEQSNFYLIKIENNNKVFTLPGSKIMFASTWKERSLHVEQKKKKISKKKNIWNEK